MVNHHDKARYLALLKKAKTKFDYQLLAYCVMDNHVHLIVKMNQDPLSIIMKWVNQNFAAYLNFRLSRNGHLFANRYHTVFLEHPWAVQCAIKYVHRNPLAARIDRGLDYPWSSHRTYLGRPENAWFDAALGLSHFAAGGRDPLKNYLTFVYEREDLETLLDAQLLSESQIILLEQRLVPGLHEKAAWPVFFQEALPPSLKSHPLQALDLIFGRLCLLARLNPQTIHNEVASQRISAHKLRCLSHVAAAMQAINEEEKIVTPVTLRAYLRLPQESGSESPCDNVVNLDLEVRGLLDLYRHTFPRQSTAGGRTSTRTGTAGYVTGR